MGDRGRSATTWISRGTFHCGSASDRQNSRRSSAFGVCPSYAITNATTTSPRPGSFFPTTAASATDGWRMSTSSISRG